MSDEDQSSRIGLWVVGVVVTAVVIGVLGYATSSDSTEAAASKLSTTLGAEAGASAPAARAVSAVYFASASSALDADGTQAIEQAVHAASADPNAVVVLSGFHDASGNAERNAELAKQRAIAVRDALIAAGVKAERINLQKPQELVGGGDAKEARHVEISLAESN